MCVCVVPTRVRPEAPLQAPGVGLGGLEVAVGHPWAQGAGVQHGRQAEPPSSTHMARSGCNGVFLHPKGTTPLLYPHPDPPKPTSTARPHNHHHNQLRSHRRCRINPGSGRVQQQFAHLFRVLPPSPRLAPPRGDGHIAAGPRAARGGWAVQRGERSGAGGAGKAKHFHVHWPLYARSGGTAPNKTNLSIYISLCTNI